MRDLTPQELLYLMNFASKRSNPLVILNFDGLAREWYTQYDTVLLLPDHNTRITEAKFQYPENHLKNNEGPRDAAARAVSNLESSRNKRCIPISVDLALSAFTHIYYRFDKDNKLEGIFAYAMGTDFGPARIGDNLTSIFDLNDMVHRAHPGDTPVTLTATNTAPTIEEIIPSQRRCWICERDVQDADDYRRWIESMMKISQGEFNATNLSVSYDGRNLNTFFEFNGTTHAFSSLSGERGIDRQILQEINRLMFMARHTSQFLLLWSDDFGEESILAYVTKSEYQHLENNVRYEIHNSSGIFMN